ncbi:MAG: F0F1 ATP synthase subunit B [Clostridia bacterium]|nr:F0F1 ATP synthase subunit B [Clostridia bacterium]
MQSLDIISVNIWHIVISLCNLVLLYFLIRKFLYKPVRKVLAERQSAVDKQYQAAKEAEDSARENMETWNKKIESAESESEKIIKQATSDAERRKSEILSDAKQQADGIVRQAKEAAELEKKKAADDIKSEIVDVSMLISEKMIGRELKEEDHRELIDSFINDIGSSDD